MPRVLQVIHLTLATAAALACAPAAAESPDVELERAVAAGVNRHREERGLAPLAWSDGAAELARTHSRGMAAGRVGFGHGGFEERSRSLRAKPGVSALAENVWRQSRAAGSVVDEALAQWLASPDHRRNLEGPFQLTGVGAARGVDGSVYLTQIFVAVREVALRRGGADPPEGRSGGTDERGIPERRRQGVQAAVFRPAAPARGEGGSPRGGRPLLGAAPLVGGGGDA